VLWSPESLFNIISFLLTFIKTHVEQSAVCTPSRDTLYFDIKKQNKTKPKPTQPEAQRRKERKKKKLRKRNILEIFLPSKIHHSLLHIADTSTTSSSYNSP
jgi:hypothetical protein